MPNRKKTGKAFKALKREGKFRRENLPQNKPKIVVPPKKRKLDLSNLPASEVFEKQIEELEQRRLGKKAKADSIANITIAAPTFTFSAPKKEPTFIVDELLAGEENFIAFNSANEYRTDFKNNRKTKNRFEALADSDDDEEQSHKKAAFQLQPATFQFQRPEFDDI